MDTTKICTRCGETLPTTCFSTNRAARDGLTSTCKKCHAAYYAQNRERMTSNAKAWAKANPDRAHQLQARALERYHRNRDLAISIYGGKCVECGSTDRLEFDHVHGGGEAHRTVEDHRAYTKRIAKSGVRLQDVYLQLLCVVHHREKTAREVTRDDSGRFATPA